MTHSLQQLTLLVPGLNGIGEVFRDAGLDVPRYPALEKLFARADRSVHAKGMDRQLLSLFDIDTDGPQLPVAALAYHGLTGRRCEGWCLHADPVQLYADRDKLLMLHPSGLAIRHAEAEAACAHLEAFYCEDGWRFEAVEALRWFLFLDEDPQLATKSLAEVMGHNINQRMPEGSSQRRWRVVINEIQMLLHDSDVNRKREEANLPLINSVWLWGAASLPDAVQAPVDSVWSDYPLAMGLGRLGGCDLHPLPAAASDFLEQVQGDKALLVLDDLLNEILNGDIQAQFDSLQSLEDDWLAPLLQAVGAGRIRALDMIDGDGHCYRYTKKAARRFWRRSRRVI